MKKKSNRVILNRIKRGKFCCPVCRDLAGIYPKSFKFIGWHPQCMCTCIPIMCSDEEFERIANGEKIFPKQPDMPSQYIEYMEKQ